MTRRSAADIPAEVQAAAEARAVAREARDWPSADRLRDEIEAAGWKVIDAGVSFRLEPAHPPDVVTGTAMRYGRSEAVPSLLDQPDARAATAILVAREDVEGAARAARALLAHAPDEVRLVVVADGLPDRSVAVLEGATGEATNRAEIVRTSAPLGQAASLNIGIRRADGRVVVVVDPSIEVTGDVVTPLAAALESPEVAIAGPLGVVSTDLRRFSETAEAGPALAIEGYLQAFRRVDAAARGPVDEAFRFYRYLDVWWSLVLRAADEEGSPSGEARVVPELPLIRHDQVAWSGTSAAERDRLSKRNFYRLMDRFRDRLDLAVAPR